MLKLSILYFPFVQTYKVKKTISLDGAPAACLLLVGSRVWVGSFRAIYICSISTFELELKAHGHTAMIHDLICAQDRIWSCSSDKTIGIWNNNVRTLPFSLTEQSRSEEACSSFNTFLIFIKKAQLLQIIEGHRSRV